MINLTKQYLDSRSEEAFNWLLELLGSKSINKKENKIDKN